MAGDDDIDVRGGLTQPVEGSRVCGDLPRTPVVEDRDEDVGEHVARDENTPVRQEERRVAGGVRLVLDDLPGITPPAAGSGVRRATSSRGTPVVDPSAICCAGSRSSLADWAAAAVA